MNDYFSLLEYVHMRGEMNSYRIEISNRREQILLTRSFISSAFQNDPIFWWTLRVVRVE